MGRVIAGEQRRTSSTQRVAVAAVAKRLGDGDEEHAVARSPERGGGGCAGLRFGYVAHEASLSPREAGVSGCQQ